MPSDVRFWPKADMSYCTAHVCFGGKADMTVCGNPLSRSLLGAKRTCRFALHMSAFDPKRTLADLTSGLFQYANLSRYDVLS